MIRGGRNVVSVRDWMSELRAEYDARLPERVQRLGDLASRLPASRSDLIAELHKIAGSAGSFGRPALGDAARDWERALRVERDLPDAMETLRRALAEEAPAPLGSTGMRLPFRPRISVVEDNADNRLLLMALLGEHADLELHGDPVQALEAIPCRPPDLLILDIGMPRLDGIALLQGLRERECMARVPAIALTAHAMSGDRERLLGAGFDAYVAKPLTDEDDLLRAIAGILARS